MLFGLLRIKNIIILWNSYKMINLSKCDWLKNSFSVIIAFVISEIYTDTFINHKNTSKTLAQSKSN